MAAKAPRFRAFLFLNPSLRVADKLAAKLTPKLSQCVVFPEKNRCLTRRTLAANPRRAESLTVDDPQRLCRRDDGDALEGFEDE